MAWTFKTSVNWSGTQNGATSGNIDTTGADTLIAGFASISSAAQTITDSKSNTWTSLTAMSLSNGRGQLYYAKNATVGTGHNFTNAGASSYGACFVLAFSGGHLTAPFVAENSAHAQFSGVDQATGSVTPTAASDLFVTLMMLDVNTDTMTIDAPFTPVLAQLHYDGATRGSGGIAYAIASGAQNPSWHWTTYNSNAGAVIATFTLAAGGGGSRPLFRTDAALHGLGLGGSYFRDPLQG